MILPSNPTQLDIQKAIKDLESQMQQLFTSGSNGKAALVAAIEAGGGTVETAGTYPTFAELVAGVESIPTLPDIPEGFVLLSYLQSTRTQIINTGFTPTLGRHTFECEFELTEPNSAVSLFGARTNSGATTNPARAGNYYFNDVNRPTVYIGTTANVAALPSGQELLPDTRYTVRLEVDESTRSGLRQITGVPDAVINNFNGTAVTLDSLALFGAQTQGEFAEFGAFRIYSFKIWDNDILVRDFAPCFDALKDKPCMYCFVTRRAFYNVRPGADFLYGVDS